MNDIKKAWDWLKYSRFGDLVWYIFHIPYLIINSNFVQSSFGDVPDGNYHTVSSSIVQSKATIMIVCLLIGLLIGLIF